MNTQRHKISKYSPGILQGALRLEVSRPRTTLTQEFAIEKRAISILTISLAALVALYLYFVASSIFDVMAGADAERAIRTIESNLATQEQQYLALSGSVSADAATTYGLAPVQSTAYVYRPGNAAMATPQRDEI